MKIKEPIEQHLGLLQETLAHLRACREALDEGGLTRRPAPGEWSAGELLAHLRGCADVFGWSVAMFLVCDQPVLPYVHPNTWTAMQGYMVLPFDENFAAFELNRRHLLNKLRALTPADWERSGTIKTQARTVYGEIRRMALHEKGHYAQLAQLFRP